MKTNSCIFFLFFTFPARLLLTIMLAGGYFLLVTCRPDLKNPPPSAGDADFSTFVALGGNFMAGYQDGSLFSDGQKYSIPALLAKQFELVGGGSFSQPLMPDNSGLGINPKPWESDFQHASLLRYKTDCEGVNALKPVKDLFSTATAGIYTGILHENIARIRNFAVPFAKISNYTNTSLGISGNANPYYARFASNPGSSSILSDSKVKQPTFFSLWAGMEDIYDYVRNGGYNQSILSSSVFSMHLDTVLSQLNTKGVIANIPEFTSFPFYTLVPWNGLDLTQNQSDSLNLVLNNPIPPFFYPGKNGFMIADPNATIPPSVAGYRQMINGEYILLTVPLDSMKCNGLGATSAELPDRYVLDTSEIWIINQAIIDYNNVIAAKAQQYNLALVDMNAYFKSVVTGIKWNGVDFNAEFVSGGFFSLDGYHPNQKGYALLANEFIRAINSKYNSTIPWVNCAECSGIKFP